MRWPAAFKTFLAHFFASFLGSQKKSPLRQHRIREAISAIARAIKNFRRL
jgi:hypothetical protein